MTLNEVKDNFYEHYIIELNKQYFVDENGIPLTKEEADEDDILAYYKEMDEMYELLKKADTIEKLSEIFYKECYGFWTPQQMIGYSLGFCII
jgi:hypothetical protein